MNTISLSADTIEILKNFAAINPSLRFKAGNELKTINVAGNIVCEATINETIPQEFAIYELPQLLSVLSLPTMKEASLIFEDDKKVKIKSEKSVINYFFTENSFVGHPEKTISLPTIDLSIEIDGSTLEAFRRAASVLEHKIMQLKVENGKAYLIATTPGNDTSNDYTEELGEVTADDYVYELKIDHVMILSGDYLVEVCSRGLTKWTHKTRPIVYFLALEME